MNTLINFTPMVALVFAQADTASGSALAVYGPMGVICAWLMFRDEKRAAQTDKLREEIGGVAHQMKGLNRNLLYVTATHGPSPLREIAQKELERAGT